MVRRLVCVLLMLLPMTAFALTLDEARQQGLVGEDWTGYVAAVSPNPGKEVQALVADVNNKRRAVYEKVAKETSTASDPVTADDVARVGAPKVFDKAAPGTYLRLQGQAWTKKP
jgi:uncharacterized protein